MPDSDISSTIDRLDQRIAKLHKIKQMLIDEFGEPARTSIVTEPTSNDRPTAARAKKRTRRGKPKKKGPTRKDQLIQLVLQQGPSSRQEMVAGTDMPMGTVSYLLNDKETFFRLQDGKWDLTDDIKKRYNERP